MKTLIQLVALFFICNSGYSQVSISKSETDQLLFNYRVDARGLKTKDGLVDLKKCKELFSLQVVIDGTCNKVKMFGDYTVSDSMIVFQPFMELDKSLEFQLNYGTDSVRFSPSSQRIKKLTSLPGVVEFFPHTTNVSKNILTFYVEFNQPMEPNRSAYQFVDAINQKGDTLSDMWRQQSFWIQSNRTLVLMIHPGRVKNGIRATEMLADHFQTGDKITLVVNSGLKTQNGTVMTTVFEKEYQLLDKDDHSPSIQFDSNFELKAGTVSSIPLQFSEPMDFGLLQKWVKISHDGTPIEGVFESEDDMNWNFIPAESWPTGTITIEVHSKVGDLCHNQFDRLFEIEDLASIPEASVSTFSVEISDGL